MSELARTIRDSRVALAGVSALAAVASIPVAQVVARGPFRGPEPGPIATAGWFVAAGVLGGYLCLQFLAARPDATEWVDEHPESSYDSTYVYLRAVIKRPFTMFVMAAWLVVLALLAPMLDISMVFSMAAGIVALVAGLVPMQPFAGPDVHGSD